MCVVREKYLYPHHSGENCTFQYFRSRQGPLPIALPSEVPALPPWSSPSLPFSVDVPQARTSPGRQGHVSIILLRRRGSWSSFELITPGSQQKRWVKSGFGVERLQGHFWGSQWTRSSENCGKWSFSQLVCLENCSGSSCREPESSLVKGSGLLHIVFLLWCSPCLAQSSQV